jgi:hypothetical protein
MITIGTGFSVPTGAPPARVFVVRRARPRAVAAAFAVAVLVALRAVVAFASLVSLTVIASSDLFVIARESHSSPFPVRSLSSSSRVARRRFILLLRAAPRRLARVRAPLARATDPPSRVSV